MFWYPPIDTLEALEEPIKNNNTKATTKNTKRRITLSPEKKSEIPRLNSFNTIFYFMFFLNVIKKILIC
jgi:hypothetical protein